MSSEVTPEELIIRRVRERVTGLHPNVFSERVGRPPDCCRSFRPHPGGRVRGPGAGRGPGRGSAARRGDSENVTSGSVTGEASGSRLMAGTQE